MSGFVGLGLAAKIAIGAGAAAAVGVTGTGAAGLAGVLPTGAQEVFNQVTGQHPAGELVSDTGLENSEFGVETSQDARLEAELEPGTAVDAEKALQDGLGTAEEQRQAALDQAEELRQAGLEKAEELREAGLDAVEGAGGVVDEAGDIADEANDIADLEGGVGVDVGAGTSGN